MGSQVQKAFTRTAKLEEAVLGFAGLSNPGWLALHALLLPQVDEPAWPTHSIRGIIGRRSPSEYISMPLYLGCTFKQLRVSEHMPKRSKSFTRSSSAGCKQV